MIRFFAFSETLRLQALQPYFSAQFPFFAVIYILRFIYIFYKVSEQRRNTIEAVRSFEDIDDLMVNHIRRSIKIDHNSGKIDNAPVKAPEPISSSPGTRQKGGFINKQNSPKRSPIGTPPTRRSFLEKATSIDTGKQEVRRRSGRVSQKTEPPDQWTIDPVTIRRLSQKFTNGNIYLIFKTVPKALRRVCT